MPEGHATNDTTHIPFRGVDQDFFSDLYKTLESANINFLLGAGCSMPTFRTLGDLEELHVKLDNKKSTLEKDREVVYRLTETGIDRRFLMGPIYRNVEYMTRSKEDSEDDIQQTRAVYKDFCTKAIQTVVNRESVDKSKRVTFFASNYNLGMDLALDKTGIPTNSAYLGRFFRIVRQQTLGNRVFSSGISLGYQIEIPSANLVKIHEYASWHHDGNQLTIDDSYQILEEIKELFGAISRFDERQPEIRPSTSEPNESHTTETGTKTSADFKALKTQTGTTFKLVRKRKHGKNNLVAKLDGLDKTRNKLTVILLNKGKFASAILNEMYYDQLRHLSNQLELPNASLLVMGFSFTDEHTRLLVARATKADPTLKVTIFYYSRDTMTTIADYLDYSPKEYPNIGLVVGPRFGQAFGTEAKGHQRLNIRAIADILRKASA